MKSITTPGIRAACAAIALATVAPSAAFAQVAGSATLGATATVYQMVAVGFRASKLIGATVYNDQNQQIAKVDDLVISPNKKLSFVVMHVGGFLGMGAKQIAVPAENFTSLNGKIVLPHATKAVLEKLPPFKFAK